MMHKILYLVRTSKIGGAEISLLALVNGINKGKYHPIVIVPEMGELCKRLEDNRIEYIVQKLSYINPRNPLPYLKSIYTLQKIIKKESIDLIHDNDYQSTQYGWVASWLRGIKMVTHVRLVPNRKVVKKCFFRFSHRLIATSNAVYKELIKNGIKKRKIKLIWNGVDTFYISQQNRKIDKQYRRKIWLDENVFVLAIIGILINMLVLTQIPELEQGFNINV